MTRWIWTLALVAACGKDDDDTGETDDTDVAGDTDGDTDADTTTDTTPVVTDSGTAPVDPIETTDTGVPVVYDATGAWSGPCHSPGYSYSMQVDLVDVGGVVTGSGTFDLGTGFVYPFTVVTGARAAADVATEGELTLEDGSLLEIAWSGTLVADAMDGRFVIPYGTGGSGPISFPCALTR